MGLEGVKKLKRPEVKVKVPKFTKIDLGGERSDDIRQVEAEQKLAKKTLKKLSAGKKAEVSKVLRRFETKETKWMRGFEKMMSKVKEMMDEVFAKLEKDNEKLLAELAGKTKAEEAAARELDKALAELSGGKKVSAKKKPAIAEKPKKGGSSS